MRLYDKYNTKTFLDKTCKKQISINKVGNTIRKNFLIKLTNQQEHQDNTF